MQQVYVVYWSGTGNTQMMAEAVTAGAKEAGAEVVLCEVNEADASAIESYDRIAFGCPSMGDEVLEETEMEPFFASVESKLSGKKVALFGSYDWGDGQWMRDWQERITKAGANMVSDGLIANLEPDAEGLAQCRELGKALAEE